MNRRIDHERAVRASAASAAGVSHSAIQHHAEQRTDPGPIREFWARDFALDGMEEGADWLNYASWHVLRLDLCGRRDEPWARAARLQLLRLIGLVIEAYQTQLVIRELTQAEQAQNEQGAS